MPLEDLKEIDNQDDRRELFHLLGFLTAAERIDYLNWCVFQVNGNLRHNGSSVQIIITAAFGDVTETYFDLLLMATHYGLPLQVCLRELERRGAGKLLAVGVKSPA